jgi:DNA-binding MarR family transcriptional regulator
MSTVMLLMRTVAAEMRRLPQPLAPPQFGLLMRIDATPMTISELARAQAVTLPTMSQAIEALVRLGWVARWIDKHDRRQTIVRLTPKGRRVLTETKRRVVERVAERLHTFSAQERQQLVATMERLAEVLAPPQDHN